MKNKKQSVTISFVSGSPVSPCDRDAMRNYTERFLSPAEIRSNSKVYIPPEIHGALRRLVKTANIPGVSLSSYVTAILSAHIEDNAPVMQAVYDDSIEDLF